MVFFPSFWKFFKYKMESRTPQHDKWETPWSAIVNTFHSHLQPLSQHSLRAPFLKKFSQSQKHAISIYASVLLLIMCSLLGEFLFLFQTLPSLKIFFSDPDRDKYSRFSAFKIFIQYSIVIGLDV